MNPALVVKLRPTGPWRIGPDSGARSQVDVVYHSDALYSAVAAAMARMGRLEEWLDATARSQEPAVRFSSCFPLVDGTGYVVPPRSLWPPTSPALMAAHVRWKSARFVPLEVVQALLAGRTVEESQWTLDGVSGCLMPAGCQGPFRTGVRFSAAVDRLTGAAERHSTACIEFRPGAGLWAIVSFADDAARAQWSEPVRAAFRLLADSGFGGERSRGWGRSETPEFIEGTLPDLILPQEPLEAEPPPSGSGPAAEPPAEPVQPETAALPAPELTAPLAVPAAQSPEEAALPELTVGEAGEAAAAAEPPAEPTPAEPPEPEQAREPEPPSPVLQPPSPAAEPPQWLLSLFTPAPADEVDWERGDYAVTTRGGRVDSPVRSGEPKKQLNMIVEGSVLVAGDPLRGCATDVAPDGFPHPVFRAGFAVVIPLPPQVGS